MAKKDGTGNRKTREQQKLEQCIREGKTKPSEMCPCTTVHELVGEIRKKTI